MKNYINYLGWILFFLLLWLKGCDQSTQPSEKIKVITKEVKGSIVTKEKIIHVPIFKTIKDTAGTGFYISQIDKLFEENNQMQLDFQQMDSLAQFEAYTKSIQINAFKQQFEDSYINAYVSGEVSGNIHNMKFDYTIKPQTVSVDTPKRKISVLAGVFIANNIQLQKPLLGAELNLLNTKGNLLKIAYDTDKRIYLGYSKKLF
jgi:hypothetical protein